MEQGTNLEGDMSELIERARIFATAAHGAIGQLRKYTFEPYIVHPMQVAEIVKTTKDCTVHMVAAAYLHDVLEDTKITEEMLRNEFGSKVTDLVVWLTNVSKPSDGNRKVRKELDRLNLAKAPKEAQTIKVADLIANTPSIVKYDEKFAKTYLPEKEVLLGVLLKADAKLWYDAHDMVIHAKRSLTIR